MNDLKNYFWMGLIFMNFPWEKSFGLFFEISVFVLEGHHVLFWNFGFRGAIFGVIVVTFSVRMWNIFGKFRVGLFSVR